MRSGAFRILLDYAKKTRSRFILPRLVYDEIVARYRNELEKFANDLSTARANLQRIAPRELEPIAEVSVDELVTEYQQIILTTLDLEGDNIRKDSENAMRDAVTRAIVRRRPCSEKGEEIRDAILWNTVLEIAKGSRPDPVAFISENRRQFEGDETGVLHGDLLRDLEESGIANLTFYSSVEDFGKRHASNIEFVTKDWIKANLGVEQVIDVARYSIDQEAKKIADLRLSHRFGYQVPNLTGYTEVGWNNLDIEEFYVYEMEGGAIQVQGVWKGEVEVGLEWETSSPRNWMARHRNSPESPGMIYVTPEVFLSFEMSIVDGKIGEWGAH